MTLISILLPLLMQSAAPVKQVDLVDLQARATQAHRIYRERARSAQRCEPQTVSANAAAARAALEAFQGRRLLVTALAGRIGAAPPTVGTPGPEAEELGKAVALLSRDLETSASLMARANPEFEPTATRGFLVSQCRV